MTVTVSLLQGYSTTMYLRSGLCFSVENVNLSSKVPGRRGLHGFHVRSRDRTLNHNFAPPDVELNLGGGGCHEHTM